MEKIIFVVLGLLALYIVFRIFKAILKWLLIIIVIILAIAFFSNPDKSSHLSSLKEMTKDFPVKVSENSLQVYDYKVFSVMKVKEDGQEKTVGIGAFGKVWYFKDFKEQFE